MGSGFRHHTSHTMPVAPVGWGGGLQFSQAAGWPQPVVGRAGIRGPGEQAMRLLSAETPPGGLPSSRMVFQPPPGSRSVAPGMLRSCSHPPQLRRSAPHPHPPKPRGAGGRPCRWREQSAHRERKEALALEKQSIHKRAQFHVFIFGRKEIIANLSTGQCSPLETCTFHM